MDNLTKKFSLNREKVNQNEPESKYDEFYWLYTFKINDSPNK